MNRESRKNRKKKRSHLGLKRTGVRLLWIVALVAVFLALFGSRSATIAVSSIEKGISLTGPDGGVYEVFYADIEIIQLIELPENYGTCIDGGIDKGFSYGLWENDEWGTYSLCVRNSVRQAILISQKGNVLVFNYEGITSTESFYHALLEAISGEE